MAGQSERCPTSICSLTKVRWPNHHDTWNLPKKENKATREAQRVFSAFMWMIGRKACFQYVIARLLTKSTAACQSFEVTGFETCRIPKQKHSPMPPPIHHLSEVQAASTGQTKPRAPRPKSIQIQQPAPVTPIREPSPPDPRLKVRGPRTLVLGPWPSDRGPGFRQGCR